MPSVSPPPVNVVLLGLFLTVGLQAQWLNYPDPGVPRTKDGKVNLSAPAPRTVDGKPDLSGVWFHEVTTAAEMVRHYGAFIEELIKVDVPGMEIGTQHKYAVNILLDVKPEQAAPRPAALDLMKKREAASDPKATCDFAPGIPFLGLLSEPLKIIQAPRTTVVLYEIDNLHRQIYTDGRKLPAEVNLPAYMGYSVGRWEGDVFVVDSAGFNDKTILDLMGHPHSEALRLTERFRRRDFGHLDYEITLDDPDMYTKPFTLKIPHNLLPDADIFEMYCRENEKDSEHMRK